jgi:hypothetical protein
MRVIGSLVCLLIFSALLAGVVGCGEDPSTKPKVVKGGLDPDKAKPQQNAEIKIMH